MLREGFWEPSFHRRFRNAGKKLALDPDLLVAHHGTVSARSFSRQRYLHGRAFGAERAERASLGRHLLLLLSSPLVGPLLLAQVIARIARRPRYRAKLLMAFPWLLRFTFGLGDWRSERLCFNPVRAAHGCRAKVEKARMTKISVVLGQVSTEDTDRVIETIEALDASVSGEECEIVIADRLQDDLTRRIRRDYPHVRLIDCPPEMSLPGDAHARVRGEHGGDCRGYGGPLCPGARLGEDTQDRFRRGRIPTSSP